MKHVSLPMVAQNTVTNPKEMPPPNAAIDCIVIGYNDISVEDYTRKQQATAKFSGAYLQAVWDSVRLNGKRINYFELLNHVLTMARGTDPDLCTFDSASLAACHLAHSLRKNHFNVEIINLFNKEKERFARLLATGPNSVAITTTYYIDTVPIAQLVRFVRQHSPRTKIIVGGPFIKDLSEMEDPLTENVVLADIGADIYVIGTHELSPLNSIAATLRDPVRLPLEKIPNLILTLDNKTFIRTERQRIEYDIAENEINWRLFKEDFYALPIFVRTAVSCPFACSFCNFPTKAGEHIPGEISAIERELTQLQQAGVKRLVFVDDTFNVPLPRFKKILRMMIDRQFGFEWISFFRCSNADDEAFDLMRASGCIGVFLGIESGDQTVLNNMNKFARTDKYIEGIRKLDARGIMTYASLICGFPGETRETVMSTIRFIDEAAPTFYNVQLYYHGVHTPIHKEAEKFKIRSAGYSWSHATMDWKQGAELMGYMYKTIKNSIPFPTYAASIWCVPYLLNKGLTIDQIKQFTYLTKELLIKSSDDVDVDFTEQTQRMAALFSNPD